MSESQNRQQIPGYQLLERLGSGGMATVYKARQLSLDRVVAVKVLSQELTRRPGYVEQFYAEGKAAAKLNHPNIVAALDVGEAGGHHYFVMEYVEGQTAYDRLMELVRFDEEEAVQIALQVARGLEHAHAAGIVHRDVKPQNMIITAGGAKLLDLGLAQGANLPTRAEETAGEGKRTVFGSPYYISPEQIRDSSKVDFRADIYSFGASLYYLVTGQVPFDAPTPQEVLRKHLREPLTPPRQLNRRISEELDQIIRVCMAKNPADRYDSTNDLVADLEAVANDEMPLKAHVKLEEDLIGEATGQKAAHGKSTPMTPGTSSISRPSLSLPPPTPALHTQPVFWAAVAGWLLALVFLGLWLTTR